MVPGINSSGVWCTRTRALRPASMHGRHMCSAAAVSCTPRSTAVDGRHRGARLLRVRPPTTTGTAAALVLARCTAVSPEPHGTSGRGAGPHLPQRFLLRQECDRAVRFIRAPAAAGRSRACGARHAWHASFRYDRLRVPSTSPHLCLRWSPRRFSSSRSDTGGSMRAARSSSRAWAICASIRLSSERVLRNRR